MKLGFVAAASIAVGFHAIGTAFAQQGDGTDVKIQTNVFEPNKVPATLIG